MFIPPNKLKGKFANSEENKSKVRLKTAHLLIDAEVAGKVRPEFCKGGLHQSQ